MLTEKIWGLFGYDFRNRPFNCNFRALVLFCSSVSTKCSTLLDDFEEDVLVLQMVLRVCAKGRLLF